MATKARKLKHGWQPDLPDHRDLKFVPALARGALPAKVDLRQQADSTVWPVYDQGQLGSCTANRWRHPVRPA